MAKRIIIVVVLDDVIVLLWFDNSYDNQGDHYHKTLLHIVYDK